MSKPWAPIIRIGPTAPNAPARKPAQGLTKRWRPAIRTTTKLRYSTRSILRARNRKPIRPTRLTPGLPRSWRSNLPNIPITPGSRTISYIHTTRLRSPPGASPPRGFMQASRLTRHMRCICRRISSRGWAPGRTRSSTNRRAFEAAIKGGEVPEAYHASDYAVYADLQLARDAAALSAMEDAFKVKPPSASQFAVAYSSAAMPARYALERGDWLTAKQLVAGRGRSSLHRKRSLCLPAPSAPPAPAMRPPPNKMLPILPSATRSSSMREMRIGHREVEIQQRAVAGWIAFAHKNVDDALKSDARSR